MFGLFFFTKEVGGLRFRKRIIQCMTRVAGPYMGMLLLVLLTPALTAEAADKTIYNSPYVSFSPDGMAWTTNAGDKGAMGDGTDMWDYKYEDPVEFDIKSQLSSLRAGQHYYPAKRTGEIPVGYWKVEWLEGQCIHDGYPAGYYHGINYGTHKCLENHYSGWIAYCADCGEPVSNGLIYMSRAAAESIEYIDVQDGMDYYYLCPFCNNLEQGYHPEHYCKEVSYNRYRVVYDANPIGESFQGGEGGYGGYMSPSIHMYNNYPMYEGETVTPVAKLTLNAYSRIGYRFAGWNTEPDGSGTFYADGARILNLTTENWDGSEDAEEGTVVLYAQWELTENTLRIDPYGGAFQGKPEIMSLTKPYGSTYVPEASFVTPPSGFTVSFETNGGTVCAPVTGTNHFSEWSMVQPFAGRFTDGEYMFCAPDGAVDTLRACYVAENITLPTPKKPGLSFGGWFEDPGCTKPVGFGGDEYTPDRDVTLYAKWVELTLWSFDNYTANNKKGAVDLKWAQPDTNAKTYKLYRSADGSTFSQIYSAEESVSVKSVSEAFFYKGRAETYTVPYSGFYTLTASGAQGGSYGNYAGGLGGSVSAKFYLTEGEKLTITAGGRNGYNGGGAASAYGCGGGMTVISSDIKGTLLIAGGGGGACVTGAGLDGGSNTSLRADNLSDGVSGMAGGGAGHVGGNAGEYEAHYHVDAAGTLTGNKDGTDKSIKTSGGCYTRKATDKETKTGTCSYSYTWRAGATETCGGCGAYAMQVHVLWKTHTYSPHNTGFFGEEQGGYWQCNRCGAMGSRWGSNTAGSSGTHPYTYDESVTYYTLSCGYFDGEVLSSSPAYGGSSYVNSAYAVSSGYTAGDRAGNGCVSIESEQIGYMSGLSMSGVAAPDLAAPDGPDENLVKLTAISASAVQVSFAEPEDNGTQYWWKAESYREGTDTLLCTSNITKNTLKSGIKGYYYVTDRKTDTPADASGNFTAERSVVVQMQEYVQYLHLAAVDVAGNVSDTIHVQLDAGNVNWKLYTGQLQIGNGENVYAASESKTYYVRSDGVTPFLLQHSAYMEGRATRGYQLNYTIYETEVRWQDSSAAQNIIYTPSGENPEADIETKAESLIYSVNGVTLLGQYPYSVTRRTNRGSNLDSEQRFTLGREAHGQYIHIIPRTGADYVKDGRKEVRYSDSELDAGNGITVIGDGEGPVIRGLEMLRDRELIDRVSESVSVTVTAEDLLSGVADFYVKVRNTDNYSERFFCPENGAVNLEITRDEPLFTGNFTVTGYAVDNVGNVTEDSFDMTEFALETRIERILEPHVPNFKCGESGILYITTYGYADRVEVEFPAEFLALNPGLNRTFDYTNLQLYRQESALQFMIPLYTPANQNYHVTVRAYKGEKRLENYPSLSTIEVGGTVLDEFRTRLR